MPKKETAIKHATYLAAYLLVVWGFYRFLFKLPEEVEELVIKPLMWLVPVFWLLRKEKAKLETVGITMKNLFPAVYMSLGLGAVFAIEGALVNIVKYQGVNFSANLGEGAFMIALVLSFVTAVSEEITFRGYLFTRVWHVTKSEWRANLITSLVWAAVHLPITIFWWQLSIGGSIGYLLLITAFGVGSSFLYARTRNITSSILLHVLWSWPIVLFR
jgi:membrane protease YdiL (CAAX protease family)